MKKIFSIMLAALVALTLAGCQKEAEPMQMLWWSDGTEGEVMQGLLDQYAEETGEVIELIEIPYADYEARLATMISGDEAPALARMTEGHLNNFKDQIVVLDDVYDASNFTNLFYNSNGEVISLPMDITANGMFVNLDLVEEYGVNIPADGDWTWAEFEAEFSKIDDQADGIYPGIFDHQGHRFMEVFYQYDAQFWNTAYTDSGWSSPEAVEALEMLMRFYDEGFLPQITYSALNSAAEFRKGTYGFHLSGNWNVSGYQDLDFNWTVVPMPHEENHATILGGKSMAALQGSGAEDRASEFIAWLSEPAQHDQYTGGVPYLTPRLGATVDYGVFTDEYTVFLAEISMTDGRFVQDWLNQVMIPGMYPMINDLVANAADPNNTKSALELLTELEDALMAAAPTA